MAVYQGDVYTFLLPLQSTPSSAPVIQIVSAATGASFLTQAGTMTLLTGTDYIYVYNWSIPNNLPNGRYVGLTLVTYLQGGNTTSSQYNETIFVGDSRITGGCALDATVAKAASVALDATVAHATDLAAYSPDNSQTVLAIKSKTDTLPTNPADNVLLNSFTQILTDIRDGILGSVVINKGVDPKTLTISRVADSTTLVTFALNEDINSTTKIRQ